MRNIATSSRSLYLLPSLSFAFFCLTQNAVDPDLWGHILFGREIIETGRVPRTDVFSYTAFGQAWINHEWLSEVIFGGLYAAFGPSGILMLKSLAVATLLILITHIRRETRCVPEFQILLSLLVISVISYGFAFRPQLFTLLFFTLLILLLSRQPRFSSAVIVGMTFLWANLHGGFVIGLAALGIYTLWKAFSALREGQRGKGLGTLAVFAAAIAVTLVNPYGYGLWIFLCKSLFKERPYLSEWQAISIGGAAFTDFKALLIVFIVTTLFSRRRRTGWLFALTCLTALISFRSNRHIPLFAICCAFFIPGHFTDSIKRLGEPLRAGFEKGRRTLGKVYLMVSMLVVALVPLYRGRSAYSLLVSRKQYPVAAVRWMKENNISGNCAVFFDWGEYLIWHTGNDVRVSIDGRFRTVYPESVIEDNFRFYSLDPGWERLIVKYPTNLALVHNQLPVCFVLRKIPGWRRVFRSDIASIFVGGEPAKRFAGKEVTHHRERDGGAVPFP